MTEGNRDNSRGQAEIGSVEGKSIWRQAWMRQQPCCGGMGAYVVGNACARDDRRKLWMVTGNES